MSNSLVTNPLIITGSVTSYKTLTASTLGTLNTLLVRKLVWNNPGNSQTLNIGDPASGNTLFQLVSDSTGEPVTLDFTPSYFLIRDFSIDVFPGGTLLIYTV